METAMLNLTTERCPMALLLAKRAANELESCERLAIQITDTGARLDIPRYLSTHGFSIEVQEDSPHVLEIIVTKRL
ncbi:sulfurtransferase TusA family protein [Photobacterium nomapromontoriensis]|uniref:sulfurtransferase TusA family protein n=1 Tax=Photobacterium nomapromontoriensis TaxID=2910237 RepID=UPI003D0A5EAF